MKHFVIDDFDPKDELADTIDNVEYVKIMRGDKDFYVHQSDDINNKIVKLLEDGLNVKIKESFGFCRYADEDTDTGTRIHADGVIEGKLYNYAGVFYANTLLSGTAFWEHVTHGKNLTDLSDFNRMIENDAKDESFWEMNEYVCSKRNRFLIYPTSRFHSRWPHKSPGPRYIYVIFFNTH